MEGIRNEKIFSGHCSSYNPSELAGGFDIKPRVLQRLSGSPLLCILQSCRIPGHCSSHASPVNRFSSRMLFLSLPSLGQLQHFSLVSRSCLGSRVRADAMSEHVQLFSSLFIVSSSAQHRLLEGRGQVPSLAHLFQGPSCLPSVLMALTFGERPT